jgi:hypothetical protein
MAQMPHLTSYRDVYSSPADLSPTSSYSISRGPSLVGICTYRIIKKKKFKRRNPFENGRLGDRKSVIGIPKHWAGGPKSGLKLRVSSAAW